MKDFVIISVGELNDNKNHQVIIRALNRLKNRQVKYVIVGKGTLHYELQNLIKTLNLSNRVIMTGFRTDIKELLWMSDCFAFPSKREGLGIAALEGMAAGLPVIGHDIGGISDFCIDGITGYLCKSNTEKEYAKIICEAKGSLPSEINRTVRKTANRFDISKTNSIMKEVYLENGIK